MIMSFAKIQLGYMRILNSIGFILTHNTHMPPCESLMAMISLVFIAGVIKAVADACIEGAVVLDLCELGDQMILEETKKVYKKEKEMKKGDHLSTQHTTTRTHTKHTLQFLI